MRRPKGQPIVGRGTAAGGGGSAQKAQHSKSPGGGVHLLDRQLVPRVEAYGQAHPLTDADAVANALRQAHREYARRPQAAFRAMVLKAIRAVQARLQQDQPEAEAANNTTPTPSDGAAEPGGGAAAGDKDANGSQEDGKERDMQVSSSAASSSASGSSGASSSSSGGSSSSSSDASDSEADAEEGPRNKGGMNNMLLSMYARTPQANASAGGSRPGDAGPATQGRTTVGKHEPAPPAFAPPEVVAAAAARALAAQKAAASGKQTKPGKSSNAGVPAAPAPQGVPAAPAPQAADSAALAATAAAAAGADANGALQPACAAGAATPGQQQTASKPNARTATEAGLQQEGRPGPSTVKRARRGGAGAAGAGGAGPRPRANSAVVSARPVTYADLGGVEDVLVDIRELIEYPLKHPEVYSWLGVEPPRGVLLHGPPGCGKTALANAIANECGVPFLRVSAPEIVSGMSGESEAKLRGLFQEAADLAPCIVFIDEIDAIAPKRETAQREMERRIVAQMLTCMDDLSAPVSNSTAQGQGQPHDRHAPPPAAPTGSAPSPHTGTDDTPARPSRPHVVVIGATNRPDALDPALRRAGRFDREITLGIPSEGARAKILAVITRGLRLAGDFDFKAIAKRTPGFVGADLMALVKEAAALAVTRIFATLHDQDQQAQAASAAAAAAPIAGLAAATEALEQGQQQQQQGDADMADATASATAAPSVPGPAPALQATQAATISGASPGSQAAAAVATGAQADDSMGVLLAGRSSARFGGGPLGPAELRGLAISMADFEAAVRKVQPSVRREGFTTTPDVTWEDVGSLDEVREELSFAITAPIMHPERFQAMGMTTATGVLLYGPPGCGKTLVAKAVAHESGANFISIKGPELLNKYVGESERAVRQLFARARAAHPCVLFFDELDALAPRRGTDTNQAAERVVNQLLTEMDGVDGRQGVYVVAATNRPDMIDPALLRPGRLDKVLYVPLPPPDGRAAILRALTRRTPLGPDVDVTALGLSQRCTGFSGADMAALVREASVLALKEAMKQELARSSSRGQAGTAAGAAGSDAQAVAAQPSGSAAGSGAGGGEVGSGCVVAMHHFEAALARMSPSVSKRDARMYDALRKSLQGNLRSRLEASEELLASAKTAAPEDAAALPMGNAAAATTDVRGAAQPPADDGARDTADPMILA